jgi:hypothetical protein
MSDTTEGVKNQWRKGRQVPVNVDKMKMVWCKDCQHWDEFDPLRHMGICLKRKYRQFIMADVMMWCNAFSEIKSDKNRG